MRYEDHSPRTFVNAAIFIVAATGFLSGLWLVTHGESWWGKIGGILLVAHLGNTLFGLLHESVHRVLSGNSKTNEFFGILCAAFFPTGLTFQRICHLGHHLRNRTDHEMFDMYYPDDSRFLKFAQFYAILTGIYWMTIPLGWLAYLIAPSSYKLLKTDNKAIQNTGAVMLHAFINHPKSPRIRLELLFTVIFQIAIFKILSLQFLPTFIAYFIFGWFWGSLQYADHAWSERDIQKGAWNLKVNPLTRLIFLNYHFHQVHHMYPRLPWHRLPRFVDPADPQPRFLSVYLEMWKGPRLVERGQEIPLPAQLEIELKDEDLNAFA